MNEDLESSPVLETSDLDFSYPDIDGRPIPGVPPVVQHMSIRIPRGARCLLLGSNGAGKTTLLKVLGGKHMVPKEAVTVLGVPPFHNTDLTASGRLSYLGGNWERDIAFAGYSIPMQGDIPALEMIESLPGVDPMRRAKIMRVLDIDPEWRMHRVSDGQRRRVQICMGLLKPPQVLLLDEITVDLDVLARADLLDFLKEESEQRGTSIIYATHIFDGLERWPTHIMFLSGGSLKVWKKAEDIPELANDQLLQLAEKWLREEKHLRKVTKASTETEGKDKKSLKVASWSNGWAAGRMTSTLKDSSNAVLRM
ncbi:ABC transporter I family member 20 [Coccomyxa sp. Obi]|nr:ABC transporter I family member 20 [Coccomyxa sp. Obi]